MARLIILLIFFVTPAQAQEWYCADDNDVRFIDTELGKQKIMIFEPEEGDAKELIFFFHGDSAFRPPSYQYDMARRIVGHRVGAMAVAVLRPGYEDGCEDKSEGDAGFKMGDNYTLEVVNALAEVIMAVQGEFPLKTTLFGHSGGAALSAILMNRHPNLANTALLAACPCDLPAWRQHMYELTGNERWISDLGGLSPFDEMSSISKKVFFSLHVSSDDQITPFEMTMSYSKLLTGKKIPNDFIFLAKAYHGSGSPPNDGHDDIIKNTNLKALLASY